MSTIVEGVGADAPMVTNEKGGKQSHCHYRCDQLPPLALLSIAKVMKRGSEKYGDGNWLKISTKEHLNHALTHILSFFAGDGQDDHLTNAACRLLMALEVQKQPKEKQRKRIYCGGPISIGDLKHNIKQATEAGTRLIQLCYAPMIPQLSAYLSGPVPERLPYGTTHGDWMGTDLPWVSVCDAVLRLPGESKGADMEVAHATSLNIPVFYSIEDLLEGLPA